MAYRGALRWVRSFEPIKAAGYEEDIRIRERGVYLITGGLGGMGLTFAKYLAQSYRAKLVLVSRSNFPSRQAWKQLSGAQSSRIGKQVDALMEIGKQLRVGVHFSEQLAAAGIKLDNLVTIKRPDFSLSFLDFYLQQQGADFIQLADEHAICIVPAGYKQHDDDQGGKQDPKQARRARPGPRRWSALRCGAAAGSGS